MISCLRPAGLAALLLSSTVIAGALPPRIEKTINRDWTFHYAPAAEPDLASAAPDFDDRRWPAIAVPHTWSTYETTRELHPFIRNPSERDDSYWWYGWGWYRKRFTIGAECRDRLVSAEFDGVQKYAKVYLNGVLLGEHKGGYTSFSLDLTAHLNFGAENILVVQVSNRRDDPFGTIPPSTAGNFDVYGGIYRDVRLVIRDRLHVPFQGSAEHEGGTFVSTPEVSAERGIVRVRTWVRNAYAAPRECTVVTTVRDREGNQVLQGAARAAIAPGARREFDQALGEVRRPQLWSPDSPYVYRVDTQVLDGARLADTFTSPLGFRWYSWNKPERRLYLNGRKILARGINRHQEFPWLGDAMPKWMHEQDLDDIRHGMGLNFQRTAHYPQDPLVYDLSDRLGFMLIEEAPNIKDIKFDRAVQQQHVLEMIRRDRNHPSILFWSMGNETNQPADSAWAVAEDTSRLVYLRRSENGGDHVQVTDKDIAIENLLRCTVRGWLNADDHDFGAETDHPPGAQVTGSEAWQHERNRTSEKLADDNVVTWIYADHGADREYLNSPLKHINPKGWVDAYRFPKLTYYLWQANFATKLMAFIHPTWWRPRYVGQRHDIRVDSNGDELELKLDGVSLGRRMPSVANAHSVVFENIEIRRGVLTAEARRGGTRVTSTLSLAGEPARLVVTTAQNRIVADRAGIAVIAADIVDAAGVHVFGANPPLTWKLEGPATLVGPGQYVTDTAKNGAMDGTMYIDAPVANLVRSTATPGEIRIRVSAPGLTPAEVTLMSVAPPLDAVTGISEPALRDAGREPVRRDPAFKPAVVGGKSGRVAEIAQDQSFTAKTRDELRTQIETFVRERSGGIDVFTTEYRAFIERLVVSVADRNGLMIADDYNFNVRILNDAIAPKKKKK